MPFLVKYPPPDYPPTSFLNSLRVVYLRPSIPGRSRRFVQFFSERFAVQDGVFNLVRADFLSVAIRDERFCGVLQRSVHHGIQSFTSWSAMEEDFPEDEDEEDALEDRRRVNSNSALCATRAPTFFARARIAAAAFRRVRRRLSSSSTTTTGKKKTIFSFFDKGGSRRRRCCSCASRGWCQ